jgi:serine/threonine protein kinase
VVSNPKELLGQILSGYRLERILGVGATGAVFYGQRVDQPAAPVAIKVFIPPWQTTDADREAFQARFRREAQALLDMQHPNIPKLLGFGAEAQYDYLILQYIDNGSLYNRLAQAQGPLPFDEIARYTQQLSSALDYAHSRKLIHRDIKPANVLLDTQGNAYLSDFSIVQLFDTPGQKSLTSTGQSVGTPEYMSPEQMRGQETGPTSDIYSLGLLVYQMVTGKVPFEGNSVGDLALKHVQEQPPYPRALRRDLPVPAEAAIIRALAKNPGERFQSATEFATAFTYGLQNPSSTNPTPAPPMMTANTASQYIPQTGATPTPFPSASIPTVIAPAMPGAQVTSPPQGYPTIGYPASQPAKKGSATPFLLTIIALLLVVLLCGGTLGFLKLNSLGSQVQGNPTATTSSVNGATSGNATATASNSAATATVPSTSASNNYSAMQPGPGCDTNGGTWMPKAIDKITCGTQLYIYPTQTYGYLYLQLPNNAALSPNNVIDVTGNPRDTMCVGLAETTASSGYMADYCGDGNWNIYQISNAGAIIHTLQKGVTSTRTSTNISLTFKGSTLLFSIDTENHTVNGVQPIQPTNMAIVYFDATYSGTCCFNWNLTIGNFGYTVLSS